MYRISGYRYLIRPFRGCHWPAKIPRLHQLYGELSLQIIRGHCSNFDSLRM